MTKNDQKQKFGLRRGFFGPNQKVQKTKYVFTRPIHPPEVELNQNFEIGTLSPPSTHSCFVEKYKISKINGKTILTLFKPSRAPNEKVKENRLAFFLPNWSS